MRPQSLPSSSHAGHNLAVSRSVCSGFRAAAERAHPDEALLGGGGTEVGRHSRISAPLLCADSSSSAQSQMPARALKRMSRQQHLVTDAHAWGRGPEPETSCFHLWFANWGHNRLEHLGKVTGLSAVRRVTHRPTPAASEKPSACVRGRRRGSREWASRSCPAGRRARSGQGRRGAEPWPAAGNQPFKVTS